MSFKELNMMEWEKVLTAIKETSPLTMGLLRSCKTAELTEERLSLCFMSDWSASKMRKAEHLEALKNALLSLYNIEPEIDITSIAPREIQQVNTQNDQIKAPKRIKLPRESFVGNWKVEPPQVICPFCGFEYVHIENCEYRKGNDNHEAHPSIRGDFVEIKFWCENDHRWFLCFGFHKGYTFAWVENEIGMGQEKPLTYHEYIKTDEWKEKARQAKDRADWRCQLCNTRPIKKDLHAHHRTYERLGKEEPGDITVLCANCHAKFHDKA
jgi:hypothetical protein